MTTRITPPANVKRRRRLRNRRIIIVTVVALALAGGGWAGTHYLKARNIDAAEQARRCPGLDSTSGEGFALSKTTDGQCIGWIIERDHHFGSANPGVAAVISKIVDENKRVRDQHDIAGSKPYVRVGVLMPMTSAPGSAMIADEIMHSLQGAYAAQLKANQPDSSELGDPTPLIQLVLANESLDHSGWPGVVAQLGRLRGGDHPLVAVTGLGISVPDTREAAEELGRLSIPSIGAVMTADDMVAPWLFKVSPSNRQFAQSLKEFLAEQPAAKTGFLVYDRNSEDSYVRSLTTALTETFDDTYALKEHSSGFNGSKLPPDGTPILFSRIVQDICLIEPDVLFYSGRDRDLPALVNALKNRGRCQNPVKPLAIATVSTGVPITQNELDAAQLGMLTASATDPEAWRTPTPGTPMYYDAFRTLFTTAADKGGAGFTMADLADGYAIMHRDAVATAVWAIRRDTEAKEETNTDRGANPAISELPRSFDVRDALFGLKETPIPGASGDIYFKEQPPNNHWPFGKPVPIIRTGAHVAPWASPETYVTK
ncbi:MAG: ABC transporter substrate-binding protein [Actinomycetota bacterium]|nr:ABC transporter substrate-binding protein [Actinomycetota bacterium]